jgi:hypothetical protein
VANRKPKKNIPNEKRTIPNNPNFNNIPANNNDNDVEASVWTRGNQSTNGNIGIFTPKQINNNHPTIN